MLLFFNEISLCGHLRRTFVFLINSLCFAVAVKLSLVLAVVVGVASALAAALLAVLCKCCWVWWRYRRSHRRRSPSHETYVINQKSHWPAGGFTYQSYENGSVADYDSISSGEEPYIVETSGDFGKLQFWLDINKEEDVLIIGLVQAKGIICRTNVQTAYVYPVIQLRKGEKKLDEREIEKQKMTFEPQWNEEVLFSLDGNSAETLSFCIQLIELDSFSNSHLIGQVELSLNEADLGTPQPVWYDIAGEPKVIKINWKSFPFATFFRNHLTHNLAGEFNSFLKTVLDKFR